MSPEQVAVLDPTILESHPDLVALDAQLDQQFLRQSEQGIVVDPNKGARHEQIFHAVLELALTDPQEAGQPSLEEGETKDWINQEEYSHSTRMIAVVGGLAVKGLLGSREGVLMKETLRERFESSIIEMLHTDREFRDKLEINRERHHLVRDGKVMALDGKTEMVGLTEGGAYSSQKAAKTEAAMMPIAARCAADVRVAKRVEELPIGGFMVGLSVDPKEAMARHGKKFYEDKGFREGLAFLQWYYRKDEHTLLAATYSVDDSNIASWIRVWNKFGGQIPQHEATDTWLDHDIASIGSEAEARALVCEIRDEFYRQRGIANKRHSVDDFLAANQSVCDVMFESLYMKLPEAYETKTLGNTLRTFVDALLSGSYNLKKDVREHLTYIQGAESLVRRDIALLEQLVRYAVTERLRAGLALLNTRHIPAVQNFLVPYGMDPAMYIARGAAVNVLDGARAGRTYGGCTKSIDLTDDDSLNPQFAFGGLDSNDKKLKKKEENEVEGEEDQYGPLKFKCTEGHINHRKRGQLLKKCQTTPCKEGSVGC